MATFSPTPPSTQTTTFLQRYSGSLQHAEGAKLAPGAIVTESELSHPSIVVDDEVHLLFKRGNFRICAETIVGLNWSNKPLLTRMRHTMKEEYYSRICPALSLATSLLNKSKPFLAKIAFASVRKGTREEQLENSSILNENYEASSEDLDKIDDVLLCLSQVLRFFRSDPSKARHDPRTQCESLVDHFAVNPSKDRPPLAILINPETLDFFTRGGVLWRDSPEHTIRIMQFELAVALVREIAHAVWMFRVMRSNRLLGTGPVPQFMNKRSGTEETVYVKTGEAKMYFSRWIASEDDRHEDRSLSCLKKHDNNPWQKFVKKRKEDLVPVSEKLLIGIFNGTVTL
ncbi:hypothetical protein OHC33_007021 [Knufia fluminis]|uniref:Uncharacterized protein n=1 Tax=Knufia fluminis TaxID=191047 RepID=A0AAN8ECA6_9EURO|nr:hypothetical protein OHC33_007021 [Knufia fluminis]